MADPDGKMCLSDFAVTELLTKMQGTVRMMEVRDIEMKSWRNVAGTFSDKERCFKNMYLETCEVYDDLLEVSLFSSAVDSYEIYFSYGKFYGIIYVEEENAFK